MTATADAATTPAPAPRELSTFGKALRQKRFVAGGIITIAVALFAILGPFFAPYGENEVVGPPYSSQGLLGTDYLGQSVLARLMYGGINVLVIAVMATVLNTILGPVTGVDVAYVGG